MKLLATTFLILLTLAPGRATYQNANTTGAPQFTPFWTKFKAAVVSGDREAVASMTKLPFEYGLSKLARADFLKSFNRIFPANVRRCFARTRPAKTDDGYMVTCHSMDYYFGLEGGEYKFLYMGPDD
ncbi:MAG: hypothetical protein AUG51_17485 [Acidobacteria bacterium 13_1_20CM_3_53_8]|nr:MAG: hypothetical protein AUG51_17485 [Acidobacteria bacterium 13_1_20CM_3_53_8]